MWNEMGDIVRLRHPVNDKEAKALYVLKSDPKDQRVNIEFICDWQIRPVELVSIDEIVKVADPPKAKFSESNG